MHGLQPPVLGLDRHLAAAGHRHPHGTEVDPVRRGRLVADVVFVEGTVRGRAVADVVTGVAATRTPRSPPFQRQGADGAGARLVARVDRVVRPTR